MGDFGHTPPEVQREAGKEAREIIERRFTELSGLIEQIETANSDERGFVEDAQELIGEFKTALLEKLDTALNENQSPEGLARLAQNTESNIRDETGHVIFEPQATSQNIEAFVLKVLQKISGGQIIQTVPTYGTQRWRQGFYSRSEKAAPNAPYKTKLGDVMNLESKVPGMILNVYSSSAIYARLTPEFFKSQKKN